MEIASSILYSVLALAVLIEVHGSGYFIAARMTGSDVFTW
eukprot:SAG31_NODE_32200_length_358_cov_2.104247_2_plen_39_part_01